MSLRILYRQIPSNKRICNYYRCQNPILRNIDRDKSGRLYHHGCLMSALDETWRCRNCFLTFDATKAAFDETQTFQNEEFGEHFKAKCPNCGSLDLKHMGTDK